MYMEDWNNCTELSLWFSSVKQVWLQMFIHNHCKLHARVYLFSQLRLLVEVGGSWDGRIIYVVKCYLYSLEMKPNKLTFVLGLENLEDTKVDLVFFFPADLLCVFPFCDFRYTYREEKLTCSKELPNVFVEVDLKCVLWLCSGWIL